MANETDPGSFWLPPQASTTAGDVDALFDLVLWISGALLAVVVLAVVWLVVKYARDTEDQQASAQPRQSLFLQVAGALTMATAAVGVFAAGAGVFMNQAVAPAGAYQVQAEAKDWAWTFTHPNGATEAGALTVPAERPVKLVLTSQDHVYAFTVPEFRVNQDVVPGRIATTWFEARRPGEFKTACTAPCGPAQAKKATTIKITPRDPKYGGPEQPRPADMPLAEWGAKLYKKHGCNACHSGDGSDGVGPTFKGLYGKMEALKDGKQVKVDDAYIAESILKPQAKLVAGYAGAMPAFEGKIDEDGVKSLIAFIQAQK